ncbi:CFI-box-CTERM domain-containing protein [Leucobacter sp. HY1908]
MQAMVCQLCSGNSFSKLDEFFQCDYCRTKYSPTEARKLLVEGTVRLDRTDDVGKYLTIADNAIAAGNPSEAYEYANRALEVDPASAQGWLVKGCAVGWSAVPAQGLTPAELQEPLRRSTGMLFEMMHCFNTGLQFVTPENHPSYVYRAATTVLPVVSLLYQASAVSYPWFQETQDSWSPHCGRTAALTQCLSDSYDLSGDATLLKLGVDLVSQDIAASRWLKTSRADAEGMRLRRHEFIALVRQHEPGYSPSMPKAKNPNSSCFVITATFGDERAPAVRLLQAYRDRVLRRYWLGRAFIDWYYRVGPRAADVIADSYLLRGLTLALVVVPAIIVALPSLAIAAVLDRRGAAAR